MTLQLLQHDPAAFRDRLRIDCDGDAVPLGDVADVWQQDDFEALDDGWASLAHGGDDATQRAWLERPRGHSKTADLAVQALWALFAARRKLTGYAAAADRDQAKLLRDAVDRLLRMNPWISKAVQCETWRVVNVHTGSELNILSADAPTAYGLTPDFLIIDEVTHHRSRDLWDALISAAAKRRRCVVVVITNAGFRESWQWETRETIRQDSSWHFSRLDGPQASWIDDDRLAEQRRLLPLIAYNRLWLNQWSSGSGDALDPADIEAAIGLRGPLRKPVPGWAYIGGVDIGLVKDACAFAVIGKHVGEYREREKRRKLTDRQRMMIEAGVMDEPEPEYVVTHTEGTGRIKLARLHVWRPADMGGRVDLETVEETIADTDKAFGGMQIGADPHQAGYLIERLQKRGVAIAEAHQLAQNLKSQCAATLEAFAQDLIDIYADADLLHDLRNLRVKEMNYGVRLDSPRGVSGHGDAATALSICLHLAKTAELLLQPATVRRKLIVA